MQVTCKLCAVEDLHAVAEKRRPKAKVMCESFTVLAEELKLCFGEEGPIPSSTELRAQKRFDLQKVIIQE